MIESLFVAWTKLGHKFFSYHGSDILNLRYSLDMERIIYTMINYLYIFNIRLGPFIHLIARIGAFKHSL